MGELHFDRESDQRNLEKIPVLETLLGIIQKDLSELKADIKTYNGVKGDVTWLKKFFWIVATGTIGSLVIAVMAVIVKRG